MRRSARSCGAPGTASTPGPTSPPRWHALRQRLPVVSFTMLPTALVVDVSRRNGMVWDAIMSCKMIGIYKPHAEAYLIAARWIGLQTATC